MRISSHFFQVLQSWLQGITGDYTLQYFIHKINDWEDKGYMDLSIWEWLQNHVTEDVFPTFSERRSARKLPYSLSEDDRAPSVAVTSEVHGSAALGWSIE